MTEKINPGVDLVNMLCLVLYCCSSKIKSKWRHKVQWKRFGHFQG